MKLVFFLCCIFLLLLWIVLNHSELRGSGPSLSAGTLWLHVPVPPRRQQQGRAALGKPQPPFIFIPFLDKNEPLQGPRVTVGCPAPGRTGRRGRADSKRSLGWRAGGRCWRGGGERASERLEGKSPIIKQSKILNVSGIYQSCQF